MKEKLYEDFVQEVEILRDMEAGTEEYTRQAKVVADIAKCYTELEKIEVDERLKNQARFAETELKIKQIETEEAMKQKQIETDEAMKQKQIDADMKLKMEQALRDEMIKLKSIKIDRNDRIIKNVLEAIKWIGTALLIIWGALKTWEFEEKGTISSFMGKIFVGLFRPKM